MEKSAIFGQNSRIGTGDQKWVPVPMDRNQVVPVPVVSGTGTHLQNRVGTSTDVSSSLDFSTLALLSLIFVHQLFRDINK